MDARQVAENMRADLASTFDDFVASGKNYPGIDTMDKIDLFVSKYKFDTNMLLTAPFPPRPWDRSCPDAVKTEKSPWNGEGRRPSL